MKHVFLCILLVLPCFLFAQEDPVRKKQVTFYSADLYYGGDARYTDTQERVNIFEGGTGFGFKFYDGTITTLLNFHTSFSLDGATPHKRVEACGDLNFEFSYRLHKHLSSVITNLNEYFCNVN